MMARRISLQEQQVQEDLVAPDSQAASRSAPEAGSKPLLRLQVCWDRHCDPRFSLTPDFPVFWIFFIVPILLIMLFQILRPLLFSQPASQSEEIDNSEIYFF